MDLKQKVEDFDRALFRLEEAYLRALEERNSDDYPYFRDSAIQRFEFTVEIFWKCIKAFLESREGITCKSPKSCIRELFNLGYITEKQTVTLLEMIDYRNLTSHTYHEEVAYEIFRRLGNYIELLKHGLEICVKGSSPG